MDITCVINVLRRAMMSVISSNTAPSILRLQNHPFHLRQLDDITRIVGYRSTHFNVQLHTVITNMDKGCIPHLNMSNLSILYKMKLPLPEENNIDAPENDDSFLCWG